MNDPWEDYGYEEDDDDDYEGFCYGGNQFDDDPIFAFFEHWFRTTSARSAEYEAQLAEHLKARAEVKKREAEQQLKARDEIKKREAERTKERIIAEEEARDRTITQEEKMHDKVQGRGRGASRKNCGCEGCMKRFQREQNEKDQKKKDPEGYKERMRIRERYDARKAEIAAAQARAEDLRRAEAKMAHEKAAVAAKKAREVAATEQAARDQVRKQMAQREAMEAADRTRTKKLRQAARKTREAAEHARIEDQRRAQELRAKKEKETEEAADRARAEQLRVAERKVREATERARIEEQNQAQWSEAKKEKKKVKEATNRACAEDQRQAQESRAKEKKTVKKAAECALAGEQPSAEDAKPQETVSMWTFIEKACQREREKPRGAADAERTTHNQSSDKQRDANGLGKVPTKPAASPRTFPGGIETAHIAGNNSTAPSKAAKLRISQEHIQSAKDECLQKLSVEGREIPAEGVMVDIGWMKARKQSECWFCGAKNLQYSFLCPQGGSMACNRCKKKLSLVMPA